MTYGRHREGMERGYVRARHVKRWPIGLVGRTCSLRDLTGDHRLEPRPSVTVGVFALFRRLRLHISDSSFNMQTRERPSGFSLRMMRERRGMSQTEIARILAVTPQRISNLEAQRLVTPEAAARYRAALATVPAAAASREVER
jgi:DNA-binding XRE family transcriptional regulator